MNLTYCLGSQSQEPVQTDSQSQCSEGQGPMTLLPSSRPFHPKPPPAGGLFTSAASGLRSWRGGAAESPKPGQFKEQAQAEGLERASDGKHAGRAQLRFINPTNIYLQGTASVPGTGKKRDTVPSKSSGSR